MAVRPPQLNDDRYRDLVLVDHGGFADVYRAKDERSGAVNRTVAIKVLKPGKARAEELEKAFTREVELLIEIVDTTGGSGFVQVIDNGLTIDGMPFLVMPYASGGSLWGRRAQIIEADLDDRLEVSLRVVRFLSTIIEVLHSRNIVHRDIKPANILIASDPDAVVSPLDPFVAEDESLLMSDLGLARKVHEDDKQFSLVGTPDFRAPECANPFAPPTMATDLYSATATVLFCLTGRVQSEDGWGEIVERDFGQAVLDWLRRGMRDEQTERYQNPLQWAGDFTAALDELSTDSRSAVADGLGGDDRRDPSSFSLEGRRSPLGTSRLVLATVVIFAGLAFLTPILKDRAAGIGAETATAGADTTSTDPTSQSDNVTEKGRPSDAASSWGIVVGADETLEQATFEHQKASKIPGLEGRVIILHNPTQNSTAGTFPFWTVVGGFVDEESARAFDKEILAVAWGDNGRATLINISQRCPEYEPGTGAVVECG